MSTEAVRGSQRKPYGDWHIPVENNAQEGSKSENTRQIKHIPWYTLRNQRILCRIRFGLDWTSRNKKSLKIDDDT
jgi:hypothetical protein